MASSRPGQSRHVDDLIVLGSGAAGLTGALVAAVGGAKVTVLEKAALVGGTTAISGGGAWIPCNPHMQEVGVKDSREDALEYLRACTGGSGDDDILVALVDHGADAIRTLEDQAGLRFQVWPSGGGATDYRPWLPGARPGGRTLEVEGFSLNALGPWATKLRTDPGLCSETNLLEYYRGRLHLQAPGSPAMTRAGAGVPKGDTFWRGTALAGALLRACLEHGVAIHLETPANGISLENGRVTGVRATHLGEAVELRGTHVLLATGGYTHNDELKRLWMTTPLVYTCDVESNEGDGHLMGIAVGAQVAGLGDAWWMPHIPMGVHNGVVNAGGTREDRILPHTMMVNPAGRRFMNEAVNYYDAGESFGRKVGAGEPNYPAWLLFDQQGVERYAILAFKVPPGEPPEWLHSADSVEGLADSIGVDESRLRASVDRFNGFARSGVDEDFHRGDNPWDRAWGDPAHGPNPSLGTLERPPFYAVPVYPGAIATRGGLRVDGRARVLSAAGKPIPGLYASGNCSNAAPAGAYAGPGATIGPAMTFGYLAALEVLTDLQASGAATGRPRPTHELEEA
jgi:succinate dehydrogenase/fumarate reductase flavoprotein subunit